MKSVIYIRSSSIYDDSRATKEIKALVEAGYRVQILGWNRDGKAPSNCKKVFEKEKDFVSFSFFDEKLPNGIGLKNITRFAKWLIWIKGEVKKNNKPNYIHACNLDAALSVWGYGKRKSIYLIYDIFDYYADSHSFPMTIAKVVEWLETSIINRSDAVIICNEQRIEQIKQATPQRLVVIHNSPDIPSPIKKADKFDYVYCGLLGTQRLLAEVFSDYASNNDISFGICGSGIYRENAISLNEKFPNFNYYGSLRYDEVIELESQAKVLSAVYDPAPRNQRLCAPNKFYEAMALGKPQIVCKGTGIDKIVEQYGIGLVIEYSSKDFYSALRQLLNDSVSMEQMGKKARALYEREYTWKIMKARLINLYHAVNDEKKL